MEVWCWLFVTFLQLCQLCFWFTHSMIGRVITTSHCTLMPSTVWPDTLSTVSYGILFFNFFSIWFIDGSINKPSHLRTYTTVPHTDHAHNIWQKMLNVAQINQRWLPNLWNFDSTDNNRSRQMSLKSTLNISKDHQRSSYLLIHSKLVAKPIKWTNCNSMPLGACRAYYGNVRISFSAA